MSLAGTLLKVAIGVALAKGVSTLAKKSTGSATAAEPGRGTPYGGNQTSGLENVFQDALGKGSTRQKQDNNSAASGGSLDDLLGNLGGNAPRPKTTTTRSAAPQGGLEEILGGLLGGKTSSGPATEGGSASGGLGDLLGALLGAKPQGDAPTGGVRNTPGSTSGGSIEDLLGTVFGGAKGSVAGDAMAQGREKGPMRRSGREDDLAAALILRAMVQAAKSDGDLDEAEKRKLLENLGEANKEEVAFVQAELKRAVDIDGLARQVPAGMEQQVYAMSLLAINLDNQTEAQYLLNLATSLELGKDEVNALHDRAGAVRIYR